MTAAVNATYKGYIGLISNRHMVGERYKLNDKYKLTKKTTGTSLTRECM